MSRAVLLVALALAAGACNDNEPICLQVMPDSVWARAAAAIQGVAPSAVICPNYRGTTPQSVEPNVDGGPCVVKGDDSACVGCLKESCCAAGSADDYDAVVACGRDHCAAACP